MQVIEKPIKLSLSNMLRVKVHKFVTKGLYKYFFGTILLVFLIQTIRGQSIYTSGTLTMAIIIFSVFIAIALGLITLSAWIMNLVSEKEILKVIMNEKYLLIHSNVGEQTVQKKKEIPWGKMKRVTLQPDYYMFYFDDKKTGGFILEKSKLNNQETRLLESWLKKHHKI